MKKILNVAVMFVFVFCIMAVKPVEAHGGQQYSLVDTGNYNTFSNFVDGYSLNVDKGLQVNADFPQVGMSLESDVKEIEIYKQSMRGISSNGYINYSNRFLDNTIDHTLVERGWKNVAGREIYIASWYREKLSRVENDKNYYVCIEIPVSGYVYTIFVKSAEPIYSYGYLLENFNAFTPTVSPVTTITSAPNLSERDWNYETEKFYKDYFLSKDRLSWGIFEPVLDYAALNEYESYIDYEFEVLLVYTEFDNLQGGGYLTQLLEGAHQRGRTLELTLQTPSAPVKPGNAVYDVLAGEYDAFLKDYAKAIADFEHPVLFRLANEMNGDWCNYSAYHTSKDTDIYKEFYIYVYEIFEEMGADNVLWIWNPNGESKPEFKWNDELMYYPGDEYVDILGLTLYNTGNYYYEEYGEEWKEFDELFDPLYSDYISKYGQPFMITEFASASNGGDKIAWVENMFDNMKKYDRIKIAVWWDGQDWDSEGNVARDYYFDDPKGVLDVFREYLEDYKEYTEYEDVYA